MNLKKACEVEIMSEEMIKPSSPTPEHLRRHRLSFLDQMVPPVFMPLVLFFPKHAVLTNLERCQVIKTSLSSVLSHFHLLAGRVHGVDFIDCNDAGVPFIQARANCLLDEVLDNPAPSDLDRFYPYRRDDVRDLAAAVQVTTFNCGGLAVTLSMCHKAGDAMSYFIFLNAWASVARGGGGDLPAVSLDSAALFPPKDISGFRTTSSISKDTIVTKRFVFHPAAISSLRERYAAHLPGLRRPTRVEALSAFMWGRYMDSTDPTHHHRQQKGKKIYLVNHAVNLRPRITDPPLSGGCEHFGNISRFAMSVPDVSESYDYGAIIGEMRDGIEKVDGEYVKGLREGDGGLSGVREMVERFAVGEVVTFNFTSLSRFPIYGADFGWGEPAWVGSAALTFKNMVTFLDTKSGDGIEAWVNLKEDDMAMFQADVELLSYASFNPPVLLNKP